MSRSRSRRAITRSLVATVAASAAAVLAGSAAAAADDVYVPEEPTIQLSILDPICDGDVPYLRYEVDVTGTDNDTVTITWLNPDGDDVVEADLPLTGRVPWPGAVAGPDGQGIDWPGWRLEGDTWVEGDEFDWVRPSVDVLFQVNPETVATVDYPPSSPDCATNPPGETPPPDGSTPPPATPVTYTEENPSLAATGATVGMYAAIAAGLAALGAVVVLLARRTRRG
ncbi:peptidase [Cellulosimicrobium arenosum]|uniref:Peptidase n=1 Tax=Cellulosimicrobium arenosum TaxID=2708133 RepID=A0A927J0U9_9MICO|nr:peptidase [Cellulosimicrobium arenosum]MBD8079793.1 peptidase [Cellulosimicrobium arenosum]